MKSEKNHLGDIRPLQQLKKNEQKTAKKGEGIPDPEDKIDYKEEDWTIDRTSGGLPANLLTEYRCDPVRTCD